MNLSKKNNDKFICYCKKITKNDFVDFLKLNKTNNFNTACNEIGAASECSACLANLEDAYISIRSNLGENKNIKYKSNISFLKKIINNIDSYSGLVPFKLEGVVPILHNKNISTWLTVSNLYPNKLKNKCVPFKILCNIFNSEGAHVKTIKKYIKPGENYSSCISSFLKPNESNNIKSGVAHMIRYSTEPGIRGSTRPHFYYKSLGSMATLHTQDGQVKDLFLSVAKGTSSEKRLLFIANMSKEINNIKWTIDNSNKISDTCNLSYEKKIFPRGSTLIELPNIDLNKTNYIFKSLSPFKPYFIIASKLLDSISVDHVG